MDIHLINLDRSVERLAEFRRANANVAANFIRWPAVDGSQVDTARLVDAKRLDPAVLKHYKPGSLGCALSHVALWEHAIEKNEPLTICEDDAVFNRSFSETAGAALAALGTGWDLVLWGWNFDSYLTFEVLPGVSRCCAAFDQKAMLAGIETFQEQRIDVRLFRLRHNFGTPCYSVSPKGARILAGHCLPIRPMSVFFPGLRRRVPNDGIDVMMNDAYAKLDAWVAFPPIAVAKNEHGTSTIRGPHPSGPHPSA